MKAYIISILFILVVIPLASAVETDNQITLLAKENERVNLRLFCQEESGIDCAATAVCNLTLNNPDQTAFVTNLVLTNSGPFHNTSLIFSNIGEYRGKMVCQDSPASGYSAVVVKVTPSGNDTDDISALIFFGVGLIFSGGGILFGFNREDPWIIILSSFVLTLLGLYMLLNGIGNFRNDVTEWTSIITMLGGGYISVRTAIEIIDG